MHHHNDSSENTCGISQSQIQTMQNKGEEIYPSISFAAVLIMYLLILPRWSGAAFLEEADAHLLGRYGLFHKLVLQQIWELQPPASSPLQGQGMLQCHKGFLSGSNTIVGTILCSRDFLLKIYKLIYFSWSEA